MTNLRVLCHLKVLQYCSACRDAVVHIVHAEAFQVFNLEVAQQFLSCGLFCEHPVFHFKSEKLRTESTFEIILAPTFIQNLFRLEVSEQFLYIVRCSLSGEKFSRRDVEECHTATAFAEMYRCKEVVFLVIQHVITHCHARRDEFCNASFDKFLCEFRVFQLVANGHSPTRSDKFRQIGVKCMVRKSCHFDGWFFACTVVASGECDAKNLA